MSSHVDERIVEMRFENAQFEKGVSQTMQSLDKLNESLKLEESGKGLNDLQRAVNAFTLSSINENVESLKDSFSVLGLVGQAAIARITNAAIDMGVNLVKSVSTAQVSAGWNKYESKLQAVQTIMAATRKEFMAKGGLENQMELVNAQLEKLNWFTDETSYNFLDMVNNIGKFTANNVELEKAVTAMQGISTWAAISGGTINEAGRAMYNLSQSLAQGAVRMMDWRSIENANMATAEFKETALQTAEALGTLKRGADGVLRSAKGNEVTIEKFSSTLSDLWFTSDVLIGTLDKYGHAADLINEYGSELHMYTTDFLIEVDKFKEGNLDLNKLAVRTGVTAERLNEIFTDLTSSENELGLRAFKAAQEAKTFSEALAAVKDAVSTGWMNTFELLFGNYEKAKVMWTDLANGLYEIFAQGGNDRNDFLAAWVANDGQKMFIEGMYNLFGTLKDIILEVREAFKNIFPEVTVANFVKLTEKFRDFTARVRDAFTVLREKAEPVTTFISDVKEKMDDAADTAKKLYQPMYDVAEVAQKVINGLYGNGQYRVDALRQAGYSYELVQNKVNELLGCTFRYTEILDENGNKIGEIAEKADVLSEATETVTNAFKGVFKEAKRNYSAMDNLISTFKGLFAILRILKNAIRSVIKVLSPVLTFIFKVGDAVLGVTGTLGDYLDTLAETIDKNDTIYKKLKELWDFLEKYFGPTFKKLMKFLEDLADRKYVEQFVEKLKEFEEKTKVVETASNLISTAFEAIKTAAEFAAGAVSTLVGNLANSGVLSTIGSGITTIVTQVRQFKNTFLGPAFSQVKTRLAGIAQSAGLVTTSFGEFMASAKTLGLFPKIFNTQVKNPLIKEMGQGGLLGSIQQFGSSYSALLGGIFDTMASSADAAGETTERLSSTKAAFAAFVNGLGSGFKTATDFADNFKNTLSGILSTIKNVISGMKPGEMIDWLFDKAKQGVIIGFIFTLAKAVSKFHGVFGGITDFLDEARKSLKAWSAQIKTKSLINIAIAVAILAGSLFLVAQLPADKIVLAGGAIVALAGMLAFITKILSETTIKGGAKSGIQFAAMAGTLLAIAGSVFIMAIALNSLADLDVNSAMKGGFYIIAILGILMAVMYALSKMTFASNDPKAVPGTLGAAASIFFLVLSLQKITDMLIQLSGYDYKTIWKSLFILIGIIGMLALITRASVGIKAGNGLGLILIALSLFLFVKALDKLAHFNYKDIDKNVLGLFAVILSVLMIITVIASFSKSTIGSGLGLTFVGIAAVLWACSDALVKLAGIPLPQLAKAEIAVIFLLGAIATILGLFTYYTKSSTLVSIKGGGRNTIATMMAFIAGLWALALMITYIASIPDASLNKGVGTIIELMLTLSVAMGAASLLKKDNIGVILSVVALIAALTGALYILANYVDADKAYAATIALGVAFMAVAGIIFVMAKMAPSIIKALGSIMGIQQILTGIMVAFAIGIGSIGISIGILVYDLVQFVGALKEIQTLNGDAIKTVLTEVYDGFKLFADMFADMDWTSIFDAKALKTVADAIDTLIPFTEVAKSFESVNVENIKATMTGLKEGFDSFITMLNGRWINGGADKMMRDVSEALALLAPSLPKLANANGSAIAANMETIATGFASFSDVLGDNGGGYNYSTGKAQAIKILAESIDPLVTAIPKISELNGNDFKIKMGAIGEGFKAFGDAVQGHVSIFDGNAKANAIGVLVGTISDLAVGIVDFMDKTDKYVSGGPKAKASFSFRMRMIGEAFQAFGNALTTSNIFTDFEAGANGIVTLASGIGTLAENTSSFVSLDNGANGKLTEVLPKIGEAFKTFGEAIQAASGFFGFGTDSAGDNIIKVIGGISELAPAIQSLSLVNGRNGLSLSRVFIDLKTGLGNLIGVLRDNMDVLGNKKVANGLIALGDAFYKLGNAAFQLKSYLSDDLLARFRSFIDIMLAFGENDVSANMENAITMLNNFVQAFTIGATSLSEPLQFVGTTIGTEVVNALGGEEMIALFTETGTNLVTAFMTAMTEAGLLEQVKANGSTVAQNALDGLKHIGEAPTRDRFHETGVLFVQGFIEGMMSKLNEVVGAAQTLASAASQALNEGLVVRSPSRLTFWTGEMTGEGLALGMLSKVERIASAAGDMAKSAFDPISYYTSAIADSISDTIGDDLVITPVLDLSQVQNGANKLSGILAQNSMLSANAINDGFDQNGGVLGSSIVFNQYNNSPKALSQIDIYRQTRNQLSAAKGIHDL